MQSYQSDMAVYATVVSTLLALLIFGLVLRILYRLLRKVLTLAMTAIDFKKLPPLAILLSLTVAATIFTNGAMGLWGLLYGFVRMAVVDFPQVVVETTYVAQSFCQISTEAGGLPPECINRIGRGLAEGLDRLFAGLLRYMGSVVALVQFLGVWAFLAWAFGDFMQRTESADGPKGFRLLVKDMEPKTRERIAVGAVITGAAYLCLCAIVAVSLFKPVEQSDELALDNLEKSLASARLDSAGVDSKFSQRFPEKIIPAPAAGAEVKANAAVMEEFWRQMRMRVLSDQEQLLQHGADSYNIENLRRVGSREQVNHYLSLVRWYQDSVQIMYSGLDRCRAAILEATTLPAVALVSPKTTSDSEPIRLGEEIPVPGGSTEARPLRLPPSYEMFDAERAVGRVRDQCLFSQGTDRPPNRGDFGFAFGFIGKLASWLLRTESMPMAQITGLIGFGLFGGLLATFIRAPVGQENTIDVFGVVWRGVSAAIVVFLAAYGGIAIVSQASGDPNPYVVFVTCLVGAVFGDDVWRIARANFLKKAEAGIGGAPENGKPGKSESGKTEAGKTEAGKTEGAADAGKSGDGKST